MEGRGRQGKGEMEGRKKERVGGREWEKDGGGRQREMKTPPLKDHFHCT